MYIVHYWYDIFNFSLFNGCFTFLLSVALYSGYVSFFLLTVGSELVTSLAITLQYRMSPQFLTLPYFIQCCSFQGCITSFYEWLVQALLWTVLCVTPPKKMSEGSNPKTGFNGLFVFYNVTTFKMLLMEIFLLQLISMAAMWNILFILCYFASMAGHGIYYKCLHHHADKNFPNINEACN